MKKYINGKEKGRSIRNGKRYYEEFKTKFWKKRDKYYCKFNSKKQSAIF